MYYVDVRRFTVITGLVPRANKSWDSVPPIQFNCCQAIFRLFPPMCILLDQFLNDFAARQNYAQSL